MTTIRNHVHQIYKFSFVFILVAIILLNGCVLSVFAKQNEEKNLSVDYSKFNIESAKNTADKFFQTALNANDDKEKAQNLKNAASWYYIMSNIDKSNSYPCIQLARIYDIQNKDSYAKAYFYRVLGLNYKDTDANFYFAEFYYKRKQYSKALEYYQKTLNYGKKEDAQTLKKIGQIYERFSDIPRANYYYKKCLELNPKDNEISSKINENITKEYENSGYYKRRLRD